jgi:hypothetical protein
MGDVNQGHAATRKLRDQHNVVRKTKVAELFQSLHDAAEAIPLRSKTQYPIYVEARTLYLLRGIANLEDVSVQDVIRQALQDGIDKRLKKIPRKKRGKTARSS